MKVLMFGWEYPPHVFGGLATANFGISEGLHVQGDIETTLCLPRPFGDEDKTFANIVAMNCVPIVYRNIDEIDWATLWMQTYITDCAIISMPISAI